MKALSIRQPYVNDILTGKKTIELRTWRTKYRGDLLLVSSLKANAGGEDLPRGMAICIVRLTDCRKMKRKDCKAAMSDGILYIDAYSWILEDVRPVDPAPVKGRLGLFEVKMKI